MQTMESDIIELQNWFNLYTDSFIMDSEDFQKNIILKREHTIRVCDEIVYIAENLNLSDEDIRLAEIIALLHDVGRFEQYRRYRTFADWKSLNHAELGMKIIQEERILDKFEPDVKNIIFKTILYHNRAFLPDDEDGRVLFFSKLVRDADKLDIWKIVLEYYYRTGDVRNTSIELELPDTPGISQGVYDDIINHRIVDMSHVNNINDFKLLQAGWIFDINFQPTFDRIIEREYIRLLKDALPETDEIFAVFLHIESYLERMKMENFERI